MKIYKSIEEFNSYKDNLHDLTFVPTMGNLHKGHISLINFAKKFKTGIIATIFVNKLQFNDKSDYQNYPKTLDEDIDLLEKHGCDHLLIPDDSILDNIDQISASSKATKLCGMSRPGHFDGVLTILNKFFEIIEPQSVIFGKKDYQQLILVKEFVEKKDLNISIIGCDTVRERSGLALSSRNNLLSSEEKLLAPLINKTLEQLKNKKNKLSKNLLIKKAKYLSSKGFIVDYIEACDTESLEETFEIDKKDILIAIAAKLGKVRLIDNILLQKL